MMAYAIHQVRTPQVRTLLFADVIMKPPVKVLVALPRPYTIV